MAKLTLKKKRASRGGSGTPEGGDDAHLTGEEMRVLHRGKVQLLKNSGRSQRFHASRADVHTISCWPVVAREEPDADGIV